MVQPETPARTTIHPPDGRGHGLGAGRGGQSLNISLPVSVTANTIEYVGLVTVPVAWFIFALYYTGRRKYVTRPLLALLFTIPAITVIFVATNPFHYLYYSAITPGLIAGIPVLQYHHGPLFLIHIGYTYVLSIFAFLIILAQFIGQFDRYRKQTLVLLVASFIPFLFNILYVIQPDGLLRIDYTPFSFTIMGILIAGGILRYRLLSATPGMYSTVVRNVPDGIFVMDPGGDIIDLNPAGEEIVGEPAMWIVGKSLSSVLPDLGEGLAGRDIRSRFREEIMVSRNQHRTYFDVLSFPLLSDDQETGYVVTLRDITEQKNAKDALETANRKLNLLSSITRHDINNQLTLLSGYLHMANTNNADPGIRNYLEKGKRALSTIQSQVEFTAQYQDIGVKAPSWQMIGRSFEDAVRFYNLGAVTTGCTCGTLEVYADPLFEKIF